MPPHAVYHDGWNNCVWLVKIKSVFAKGKVLGKAKCAKRVVLCYVSNKTKCFSESPRVMVTAFDFYMMNYFSLKRKAKR